MQCLICGEAGAACGGPSHARPIDESITLESTTMADENEMVTVHVDDGTKRGHDRKFSRKDAERFMSYTPGAKIAEDEAPAEEGVEAESKAVERAPANKARAKAESK